MKKDLGILGRWGGISLILLACVVSAWTDVVYPPDARVFNVKAYGALGNGSHDDTAAIKAAITAALDDKENDTSGQLRYGGMAIVYIPNGTYLVNDTLQSRDAGAWSDGWISGMVLQGQSQTGTILKLPSAAVAFASTNAPKAVIKTGSENPLPNAAKTVTALTHVGTVATATCASHGFSVGTVVDISGATPGVYTNAYARITGVPNANTFTYNLSSSPATSASGTIKVASYTPGEGVQAFYHYIRDLTVDVGSANPGAVGIDLLVNNRGGLDNVTVRSDDYSGYTGVMMDRRYPGPGLLKNVTVVGFATGISMRNLSVSDNVSEYGMTFENIFLSHQGSYGIDIHANTASFNQLVSTNSVPVINLETTIAHLVVLNGTFTGGSASANAISGDGSVYCRSLSSTGYGYVIHRSSGPVVAGGTGTTAVAEYASQAVAKLFASNISGSISLPIEDFTDFSSTDTNQWANAAPGAAPASGTDSLATIQAAIDSGKPVVYLPHGLYTVSGAIHLRGAVQKLVGCCAKVNALGSYSGPLLVFDGGGDATPTAIVQDLAFGGNIEHNSAQNLALKDVTVRSVADDLSGTGNLYLEDVQAGSLDVVYPQCAWARQLNIEHGTGVAGDFIENDGGLLWILGYKTEAGGGTGSLLANIDGAWTELLGGFFKINGGTAPSVPMISSDGSSFSVNYHTDTHNTVEYSPQIQENGSNFSAAAPYDVPLYSGAAEPFTNYAVILDNTSPSGVTITGAWTSSSSNPGYYGINYINDGDAGKGTKSVRYTPTLAYAGSYEVYARWSAGSNRADAVPIDVIDANGTHTVTVNQQTDNGEWVDLGTYHFNAGASGSALIRTTGTTGYVIADAVEFVLQ